MEETKFNKALLVPIITAIALVVKMKTGYEVSNDTINVLAEGIMAGIVIAGFLMKPKKAKK